MGPGYTIRNPAVPLLCSSLRGKRSSSSQKHILFLMACISSCHTLLTPRRTLRYVIKLPGGFLNQNGSEYMSPYSNCDLSAWAGGAGKHWPM